MKTLRALIVFVIVVAVAALVLLWTGMPDVAADSPHSRLTAKVLELARERSVARRSREIEVPQLDDTGLVASGAGHYAAMCTGCHLAPGMSDTELRKGLSPRPPDLTRARQADPRRAFWIVKHGVKMTGMPAWGITHDDQSIWGLVAFVAKLPDLSAEEYAAMTRPAADSQGAGTHDHATHDHGATAGHDHARDPANPDQQRRDEKAHDHATHRH